MSLVLLEPAAVAELDRRTIEDLGVPSLVLMESAAGACVRALMGRWEQPRHDRGVVVLCGPGNNGADGSAIARRLAGLGVRVEAILLGTADALQRDAATQWGLLGAQGVPRTEVIDEEGLTEIAPRIATAGVVVDALFGAGLNRPLSGLVRKTVEAVAAAGRAGAGVLAVDIPSGAHGGTGAILGAAAQADLTVTFGTAKVGHFTSPGRALRGVLVVADIGVPLRRFPDLVAGGVRLIDASDLARAVPLAGQDAHKGTFGHVLVVAGGPGKAGAARLVSEAALRAGAGLVTLAVPSTLPTDSLGGLRPEVMLARVPGTAEGTFGAESVEPLLALAVGKRAVALGPGIGVAPEVVALVQRLVASLPVPVVVDADALNCLALAGWPADAPAPRVLTPHPGELDRLAPTTPGAAATPRLDAARALAQRTGAIVVLKGAGTLVVDPTGAAALNPSGNPGMGTAGSGDVLTGVLSALLARGVPPREAAEAAVFWHGLSGDLARDQRGEPSLVAGDLIEALPAALLAARSGQVASPFLVDPAGWTP